MNKEIKGTKGRKGSKYPPEIRTQAIGMYHNCRGEYTSNVTAARHIANLLGVTSFDTILNWVKQDQIDKGVVKGMTTEEHQEVRRLKREVAELKRANSILKAASIFFAAELDRPQS